MTRASGRGVWSRADEADWRSPATRHKRLLASGRGPSDSAAMQQLPVMSVLTRCRLLLLPAGHLLVWPSAFGLCRTSGMLRGTHGTAQALC